MGAFNLERVVIIGNGGAGKSWLAGRIAAQRGTRPIELDAIHWEPGGFNVKREPGAAIEAVRAASLENGWVIEGVYGRLAEVALPRATGLIWLDIAEAECAGNLSGRDIKSGESEESRNALLQWVSEYRTRGNANSFLGHERLFSGFDGAKLILHSRDEITDFLAPGA